jgi:hypothetical protein
MRARLAWSAQSSQCGTWPASVGRLAWSDDERPQIEPVGALKCVRELELEAEYPLVIQGNSAMLLVNARVDRSFIHGLGLFAVVPIPKGSEVWQRPRRGSM